MTISQIIEKINEVKRFHDINDAEYLFLLSEIFNHYSLSLNQENFLKDLAYNYSHKYGIDSDPSNIEILTFLLEIIPQYLESLEPYKRK